MPQVRQGRVRHVLARPDAQTDVQALRRRLGCAPGARGGVSSPSDGCRALRDHGSSDGVRHGG